MERTNRRLRGLNLAAARAMFPMAALGVAFAVAGCSQPLGVGPGGDPLGYPGQSGSGLFPGNSANPGSRTVGPRHGSQSVISGLRVSPATGWTVQVESGVCSIAGKTVTVPQNTTVTEEASPSLEIKGERCVLSDDPARSFDHGSRLKGLISDTTPLPNALDPGSLKVWSAAEGQRQQYHVGADYLVDPVWGTVSRVPTGSIKPGQPVYLDYQVRQLRLDLIEVRADGSVALKKGQPAKTAPLAPDADPDAAALATVFLDYGTTKVDTASLFPIGTPYPEPLPAERQAMAAAVAKTRAKLQANSPVTIAFWGDSVTAGGGTSTAAARFPDLVVKGLSNTFHGAKITTVNAGVDGSNIEQRLPTLNQDVLSHHPDLVVVEFVNDMGLQPGIVRRAYSEAVQKIKAAGAEVLLTTPHFTMPQWMGIKSLKDRDPRPNVAVIREVARAERVGLVDVSRRWEHLASEGIPYTALLYNGINHPDDRGHAIYAHAIQEFF